jgi:hypothetical protein
VKGRASDGPVELRFHAWDADRFREGVIVPYQVKLSIEGLPHHAWYQDVVEKVLGDVAVIHHVEQATRRKEDLRFYGCWAFCQDPNRIPQTVFLTLLDRLGDPRVDAQLHFTRPRNVKREVFKILIHIDSVEDLRFYHYPPEQLTAEGRVQLRDFRWFPGRPDGDVEEDFTQQVERYCRPIREPRRFNRDEDEEDGSMGRQRGRDVLGGVSRWFGSHRRESRDNADRRRRDHGDQYWRHVVTLRSHSPPPNRGDSSSEERCQLRRLWREKSHPQVPDAAARSRDDPPLPVFDWRPERTTEAITIIPHQSSLEDHATQSSIGTTFADQEARHPVQIIIQTNSEQPAFDAHMQYLLRM